MKRSSALAATVLTFLVSAAAPGQGWLPPGNGKPVLVVEPGGPRGLVTALAFAPDGKYLYAAGYDKTVRVWAIKDGRFTLLPLAYRVPVGPGPDGALTALAVSPDGRWLTAAGRGFYRGAAALGERGIDTPAVSLTQDQLLDQGAVYVFDTRAGKFAKALTGHRGLVLGLAFAPRGGDRGDRLVSLAREEAGGWVGTSVRVWDVAGGREENRTRVEVNPLPSSGSERPGLAVTRGPGRADLSVAVALRDGEARLWDAAARDGFRPFPENARLNDTAAFLPDGTLLTGSYDVHADRGQLRCWRVTPGGDLRADDTDPVALDPRTLPRAPAVVNGRDGRPDLLAYVLRPHNDDAARQPYRLQVRRLTAGGVGRVVGGAPLWTGGTRQPVLAASADGPDGVYFAAAGGERDEIRVYRLAGPGGAVTELEPLRGAGAVFGTVEFVRAPEKKVGLRLGGPEGPVFDVTGGKFTGGADWEPDGPDPAGWDWKPAQRKNGRVPYTVSRDGKAAGSVAFSQDETVLTKAFLPGAAGRPTLLAVATQRVGEPSLHLYALAPGEGSFRRVRTCVGHVGPVRSLAFRADGRFLASASDDQTVAVWPLNDLDGEAAKRGHLAGLTVRERDGRLRVGPFDRSELSGQNRAALERAGVREGDPIEGLVRGDALQELRSSRAFYHALWEAEPGTEVELRVAGRGKVRLVADRAVDRRGPLFSLFVTRGERGADREWIGWSPEGPYDTGAPDRTDRYLLWLTNNGKADEPVSTVPVAKYQKEFYRNGILPLLLEHAGARAALDAWRNLPQEKEPHMALRLEGPGLDPPRYDADNVRLVRQPPRALSARFDGNDFNPGRVKAAEWELVREGRGAGERRGLTEVDATNFKADLGRLRWERGVYEFRFVLTPTDDRGVPFVARLKVRYAPAPPDVEVKDPPKDAGAEGKFTLEGAIGRGASGPDAPGVRAEILLNGKVARTPPLGEFRETLVCRPGENRVELRAVNEGAGADSRAYESDEKSWTVMYTPPPPPVADRPVPAPVLSVEAVEHGGRRDLPPAEGAKLVVHSGEVRVSGRVKGERALKVALCNTQALKDFERAKDRSDFRFTETLYLRPGDNAIPFEARIDDKAFSRRTLRIRYEPDLPEFVKTAPADTLGPGDSPGTKLEGNLKSVTAETERFTATVRVNRGEPSRAELTGDLRRLTAGIRLRPGANTVVVELRNDYWSKPSNLSFYVPQPPADVTVSGPDKNKTDVPRPTISAVFKSALPPTGARILVGAAGGGQNPSVLPVAPEALLFTPAGTAADGTPLYRMEAVKLALPAKGENRIQVYVSNKDGQSLRAGLLTLTFSPPATPPVVSDLKIDGKPDVTATATLSTCSVSFRVRTEPGSPVTRIRVLRGEAVLAKGGKADLKAQRDGTGLFEAKVALERGRNDLTVLVENEGGPQAGPVRATVTYVLPRVKVRLLSLESRDRPGNSFPPADDDEAHGETSFTEPNSGSVYLNGEVEWADANDPDLAAGGRVRVSVNAFEQPEADLEPRDGTVRRFRVPLLLNKKGYNQGELVLLSAKAPAPARFTVCCSNPERRQRLNLFVFGPGKDTKATQEFAKAVLDAFQLGDAGAGAAPIPEERWVELNPKRGAFSAARLYLMASDSYEGRIRDLVWALAPLIQQEGERDEKVRYNDLIAVYFQGKEELGPGGHYLLTEESVTRQLGRDRSWRQSAVDCNRLRQQLAGLPGAKVLLLDTDRAATGAEPVRLPAGAPKVVVIDHVWLNARLTPEEERLARVLRDVLPKTRTVKETIDRVASNVNERKRRSPKANLFFDLSPRTEELPDLEIGGNLAPEQR